MTNRSYIRIALLLLFVTLVCRLVTFAGPPDCDLMITGPTTMPIGATKTYHVTSQHAISAASWSPSAPGNGVISVASGTSNVTGVGPGTSIVGVTATITGHGISPTTQCSTTMPVTVVNVTTEALPSRISAAAECEIQANEKKSIITITTDPAGSEDSVTVVIKSINPTAGTEGPGTLTKQSANTWIYQSYAEPKTELHPITRQVKFEAKIDGDVCPNSETFVNVISAFGYLTGPPVVTKLPGHAGAGAQYQRAYDFIRCKYACISGNGNFGVVTLDDAASVACGNVQADACTNILTGNVTFGLNTFTGGSENFCASTLGDELKHTPNGGAASECTAYSWEVDNTACTGLQGGELDQTKAKKAAECN